MLGFLGGLGPGRHRLDIRDHLPVGIYLARLSQGGRTSTTKAIVLGR